MLTLYFIRHGQTEWNVEKRMQGRLDSNLTEKGILDAQSLGEHLKGMTWTAIYCSPSKRTMDTLDIVKGKNAPAVHTDERLMEIHLGNWQGLTLAEIKTKDTMQYDHYWNNPSKYQNNTGETFADLRQRIGAFMEGILEKYKSGNILIMTHGVVIKMVQLIANQHELDRLWKTPYMEGTSVTKLNLENETLTIESTGDLSHLH